MRQHFLVISVFASAARTFAVGQILHAPSSHTFHHFVLQRPPLGTTGRMQYGLVPVSLQRSSCGEQQASNCLALGYINAACKCSGNSLVARIGTCLGEIENNHVLFFSTPVRLPSNLSRREG